MQAQIEFFPHLTPAGQRRATLEAIVATKESLENRIAVQEEGQNATAESLSAFFDRNAADVA